MANQEEVRDVYGYFEQKGNALCYRYEAERVRIEPWGADSLRVRAWKTAEMDPADWALIKPEKEITPEIEVREDGATIRNGKILVLPVILMFIFLQKYIVGGLVAGAVKD